ncbi:MAG TPA: serine/threonine-protein kinase, partial [Polyangiales bacterium]
MGTEGAPQLIDGRYRIDAKLGEGGMGVVHQVFDRISSRTVALKCLTAAAAKQPVVVSLFEREFHTLKSLAHPHIVSAYGYGIASAPYYTMELLSGTTANQLAPMPWRQACSVLRDVASALALIHSRRLVHRDVTSRNIQQASDGTIKLIDFGSLTPMGVTKDCVGTPAFMAPETVHRLALDQRTDIYSLGATAYHLLTGRHAYPARHMGELRDAWRSRPLPPSALIADVPAPLDELVMSMLDLNALARPVSAGIVFARLSAVAGLPAQTSEAAARSFLITPRLVGREDEVRDFRTRVVRAMRREGSCLLIAGQTGMGRSRILDAFSLEAQVAGALVVRADAGDGANEGSLVTALRAGLREDALERPARDGIDESAQVTPGEAAVLKDLRRVLRERTIVVLIDDAHVYSAPALALVARLLRMTEHRSLVLVVSHALPLPDEAAAAMRLLRAHADRVELGPLDLAQITDLLASCFDNAPNLRATATFCHTVSAGRPGTCVAVAQHLVDHGIAAYDGGVWALPESLAALALPDTAERFIEERVRRLDADQRLWGQLLSIIPAAATMTTAECVDLMRTHTTRERSHAAVAGLVAERLVSSMGAMQRVAHASVRDAFLATLPQAQARSLHTLLAEHFEARGDELSLAAAAHHFQQAGDRARAIRTINRYAKQATRELSEEELAKMTLPFGEWGATFESALDSAEAEGWPRRELYPLYVAIMSVAALSVPSWLARGAPLFRYLTEDTGLGYFSEEELSALETGARVSKWKLAFRMFRAALRRFFVPKGQRGLNPIAALPLLGVYVTSALGVCNVTQTFHTGVPPLARALLPFRVLSPALDLTYELLVGAGNAGRGLDAGWQRLQDVLRRLQRRVSGMPDIYRVTALCILRYLDALERLAPIGDPSALSVAQWLEDAGGFTTHAWQLRMIYYVYTGDSVSAERCRQEIETLALTSARDNLSVISGSKDLAQAQALCGDAPALRATLESLEATAERFPHWRGQLLVYRGEYARLVGDLAQAREALEKALAFAPAGENYSWAKAVPPYVEVLIRLGLTDEAAQFAEHALSEALRVGIGSIYLRQIETAAALAWAAQGQHERAARRLDELFVAASEQGVHGVTLAVLEEARARVALLTRDAD